VLETPSLVHLHPTLPRCLGQQKKCFNARKPCAPPRKTSYNAASPSRRVSCVLKPHGNVLPASALIGGVCLSAVFDLADCTRNSAARWKPTSSLRIRVWPSVRLCNLFDLLLKVHSYSRMAECICGNSKRPRPNISNSERITSGINHAY
jgi:hypothetical protein